MVASRIIFLLSSRGYLASRRARLNPPNFFPRGLAIPMFLAMIGRLGLEDRGLIFAGSSSLELSELVSSVSEVELSELLVYSLLSSDSLVNASLSSSAALGVSGEGGLCGASEMEFTELASMVFIAMSSSSICSMVGECVPGDEEGEESSWLVCRKILGCSGDEEMALFRTAMNSSGDDGEPPCLELFPCWFDLPRLLAIFEMGEAFLLRSLCVVLARFCAICCLLCLFCKCGGSLGAGRFGCVILRAAGTFWLALFGTSWSTDFALLCRLTGGRGATRAGLGCSPIL